MHGAIYQNMMRIDSLQKYYETLSEDGQKAFVEEAKTTQKYIYQLYAGVRQASPALVLRIEAATHGSVTRQEMRPDLYPPEYKAADDGDATEAVA